MTAEPLPAGPRPWRFQPKRTLWLCLAAAAVILLVRKTDGFLNPQFWGEDAHPFFIDALFFGGKSCLYPYAGYSHLLPRVIAWAGTAVDVAHAPAFYVYASALITLGIVALAISPRLPLPGQPLVALAIVAVPHSGEVFLTPTNLQWILAAGLFLTLLKYDPVTTADWVVDTLVIVLCGLSGLMSILLLPFFVVRAWVRRTPASAILLVLTAATALVQAWIFLRSTQPPPMDTPVNWKQLFAVFSVQVPLSIFGAPLWSYAIDETTAIVLGVGALALFAWISLSPGRNTFQPAVAMWLFGVLIVAAAEKRVRFDNLSTQHFDWADRYFFIPKILLLWMLVTALDRHSLRGRVAAGALALAIVSTLPVFRFPPMPDLQWEKYADRIRAGEPVTVPINPDWSIDYPARPIRRE